MTPDRWQEAAWEGVFSTESQSLRCDIRSFMTRIVAPQVDAWERAGHLPLKDLLRAMAKYGWVGMRFSSAYGGKHRDVFSHAVLAEEMGRVPCGGFGMACTVHIDMTAPLIADYGSPELCQRFLAPALRGDCVLAHAVSERDAGTDIANVQTIAQRVADYYVVNGVKTAVCNALTGDAFGIMARLPGARKSFDQVLLMVPRDLPGLEVGPPLRPMGNRACDVADVRFHNVRVPVAFRIGAEGLGFIYQMKQFQQERILSACRANAAAAFHLELARQWCHTRTTFGQSLIQNQVIRFRLAELQTDLALSRQTTYAALSMWHATEPLETLSAISKLRSSQVARRIADAYLQFSGAAGFRDEALAARFYRDSRLYSIATGADEMMLISLAKLKDIRGAPMNCHTPFSAEHEAYRDELRRFVESDLLPGLDDWDRDGDLPVPELIRALGERGLLKRHFPEKWGGEGKDLWYSVALHEELARVPSGALGMALATHLDIATAMLARYATPEVADAWVPRGITGHAIMSLAITESDAGSDMRGIASSARCDGDVYLLNGHKHYITNGSYADGYVVLAKTGHDSGLTAFTLFFVPRSLRGVEPGAPIDMLGTHGTVGEVRFHNVELPSTFRIGGEGQGMFVQLEQFDHERSLIAVRMAAMAQWHLERTVAHCRGRVTFGHPLADNQAIQFRLAEHFAEVEELRQLTYHCVRLLANGYQRNHLAPMAKLAGSRVVRAVADTCLQLHGGLGYLAPHLAERFFRDARGLAVAGGTDEMMLELIGRNL